jgi:transposase
LRDLSASEKKALKARPKGRNVHYPKSVRQAVAEGLKAGREPKSVLAHYGVRTFRLGKPRQAKLDILAPHEDAIRTKVTSGNRPNSAELKEWLLTERNCLVGMGKLLKCVKRMGLKGRLRRNKPSKGRRAIDPYLSEIRALIPPSGVVDFRAVQRLLADKGVKLTENGVRAALRARGIRFAARPRVFVHDQAKSDLRAWMSSEPFPSLQDLCERLDAAHQIRLTVKQMSDLTIKFGGKPRAAPNSRIDPHLAPIRKHLEANPGMQLPELSAWIFETFGITIGWSTLKRQLERLGV